MRFNTNINNVKCIEWGLNATQGALFDLLNQLASWASTVIINDVVYYHISKNKIIEELPLFFRKRDCVYRNLKILKNKKLINHVFLGGKDLVCLTDSGKSWNCFNSNDLGNSSVLNPSLGSKTETPSGLKPTYNSTSIINNTPYIPQADNEKQNKNEIENKKELERGGVDIEKLKKVESKEVCDMFLQWLEDWRMMWSKKTDNHGRPLNMHQGKIDRNMCNLLRIPKSNRIDALNYCLDLSTMSIKERSRIKQSNNNNCGGYQVKNNEPVKLESSEDRKRRIKATREPLI